MQSDPSPLGNLKLYSKLTATYVVRQIVWLLEANWANDTTSWANGTWTDETQYQKSAGWNHQIFPFDQSLTSLGAIPPWTFSAGLRNTAGRFSPQRTDGALYASIQGYKIYQTPVRFWAGLYYPPGATLDTARTLNGAINSSVTAIVVSASVNKGEILRIDSEDMLATTTGTSITVVRGIHNTIAASHSNSAAVTRVGGMTLQFAGVIDLPPDSAPDFNSLWNCIDRLGLNMQGQESTTANTDVLPEDAVGAFLDAIPSARGFEPIPSGQRVFENCFFCIGATFLDKESVIRESQKAASGDGAIFFVDKEGTARLWNMQHWIGASSVYTFDHANTISFRTRPDPASLFTEVDAEYAPRNIGSLQVVHTATEVMAIPAATSAAYGVAQTLNGAINASVTAIVTSGTAIAIGDVLLIDSEEMLVTANGSANHYTVTRGYANTTAASHLNLASISKVTAATYSTNARLDYGCTSITTPLGGTLGGTLQNPATDTRDYVANTGGGTDYTASVTLSSFTVYAANCDVVFSNWNTVYGVFVTRFQIRGTPILGSPTKQVVVKRTTTPAISHRVKTIGGNARNWNSQSEAQTTAMANMLADRWSVLRPIYEATVRGVAMLEAGDVVTFDESITLSATKTAIVMSVKGGIPGIENGKPIFNQDLVCIDYTSLYAGANTALIGTTALGTGTFFY